MSYYTLLFGYNSFNDAILKNTSIIAKLLERFGIIVNTLCRGFNTENAKMQPKGFYLFYIIEHNIYFVDFSFLLLCKKVLE